MNETERQLAAHLHDSQAKHTYFLLAAAASAIAFAVHVTANSQLHWSMSPLGIAVLCWACSFFAGCRNRDYSNSTTYANCVLFDVLSGRHPECGNNPDLVQAAATGIRRAMEQNSDAANKWFHWQFRFLVTGAVFFVVWHLIEMILRSYPGK